MKAHSHFHTVCVCVCVCVCGGGGSIQRLELFLCYISKLQNQSLDVKSNNFLGFELLTEVVMKNIFFWNMTPCFLLSYNRRFGGTYRLHLQGRRNNFSKNQQGSRWQASLKLFLRHEDGGDMFPRNVGYNSTDYMASYPRRKYSSNNFLFHPMIFNLYRSYKTMYFFQWFTIHQSHSLTKKALTTARLT
jgi:hypothetical protein